MRMKLLAEYIFQGSTSFSQFVQLVTMASITACNVAPESIPIQRPFPRKSNQKLNTAAIGIPKR